MVPEILFISDSTVLKLVLKTFLSDSAYNSPSFYLSTNIGAPRQNILSLALRKTLFCFLVKPCLSNLSLKSASLSFN